MKTCGRVEEEAPPPPLVERPRGVSSAANEGYVLPSESLVGAPIWPGQPERVGPRGPRGRRGLPGIWH